MARLKKFLISSGRVWGIFETREYELRGEVIFERITEKEKFIAWLEPKSVDIDEWLREEIKLQTDNLTNMEEKERENLKAWLQALEKFGVPIEYEEED